MTAASSERVFGTLKVLIDRTICVGFGDCIDVAPDAFELDEEGIVAFSVAGEIPRERLLEACAACPVDALTVIGEDGRQLVP